MSTRARRPSTGPIFDPRQRLGMTDKLGELYLHKLCETRRGRIFMLSFLLQAEEADEQGIFDRLRREVHDPELHNLVAKHEADEVRHARLWRDRIAALGATPMDLPDALKVVQRIEKYTGAIGEAFIDGRAGVMETYLVLQVIEERGVRQFPLIADALRPHDRESAAILDGIARDEERHVKYAKAISARYAPSQCVLDDTLARLRTAERRAFVEQSAAMLSYGIDERLADLSSLERVFWKSVALSGRATSRVAA